MRILTIIGIFLALCAIVAQYAPIVAAEQSRAKAEVVAAEYKVNKDTAMVKACANGTTNTIMYKGVMCKR